MNKSPLSSFDNYKAIFNGYNIPQIEIDYPVGKMVSPLGQKYQPLWILMDDKLYLGDIYFYALSDESAKKEKFPRGEQYKELEQLTGVPFDKNSSFKKEDLPIGEKGVMPADWFDGVILVKERRGKSENLEKWKTSPYYKLELKKGKLQSVSKIEAGKVQTPKQQMYLLSDTGKDLMERMLPLYEKIFYYFHQIVHLSEFDAREGALALVITLNEDNLKDLCKHL